MLRGSMRISEKYEWDEHEAWERKAEDAWE